MNFKNLKPWNKMSGILFSPAPTFSTPPPTLGLVPYIEAIGQWKLIGDYGWLNEDIGYLATDENNYAEWMGPDMNPNDESDWFCEVAMQAYNLSPVNYKNTVFSQHGSATGWEVRVANEDTVTIVFTTTGVAFSVTNSSNTTTAFSHTFHDHNELDCPTNRNVYDDFIHVVVFYKKATQDLRCYVNGVLTASKIIVGSMITDNRPPRLGRNIEWQDRYFYGDIAFPRARPISADPSSSDYLDPDHLDDLASDLYYSRKIRLNARSTFFN